MPADLAADGAPPYLRTARSPRMLILLVLLLGAAAVCARLGVWQLDRAAERGQVAAERAEQDAAGDAVPQPLDEVLPPQAPFRGDLVGTDVVVVGTFGEGEVVVVDRVSDGQTGVLVLTPLVTAEGAVLPVVRGWVPDAAAAAALDPLPSGAVEVAGFLQGGEAGGSTEGAALPEGQVDTISPAELVNRWGGPMYSAYLVQTAIDPAQDADLVMLDRPEPDTALNVQNVAYALQWWIFGAFAVLLWARLVRDEARAQVEDAEAEPAERAEPAVASP